MYLVGKYIYCKKWYTDLPMSNLYYFLYTIHIKTNILPSVCDVYVGRNILYRTETHYFHWPRIHSKFDYFMTLLIKYRENSLQSQPMPALCLWFDTSICIWLTSKIQGTHKRMAHFQKLTRNLFLTLHGHNVNRQQRQLSKFLMRYQQFICEHTVDAADKTWPLLLLKGQTRVHLF